MLVVITVFLLGSHFSMKGKQSKICRWIGVKNLMTPCPMQRLLELLVLRNLTGRIPSPSWSQMLTPKVKPSFRLNFVEDILSYWLHAQLIFCFHSSIKFLIHGLFKRCKRATFGGLGEPSACSLTTENV